MVYLIGYECPWDKYPTMRFLDGDPFELEWLEDIGPITTPLISLRQKSVAGYPIKSINVPTTLQWLSRHEMPDFEGPPGFICVSSRFKDVVERFEPDVHQFFPITVVNKAKEKIAERWLWVVCNRIDGVDREHTTFVLVKGALWMSNWDEGGRRVQIPDAKIYHSKSRTEGYHFWRDKHIMGGGIYASDEAAEALQSANLSTLRLRPEDTV
jgi:hypothetical protein